MSVSVGIFPIAWQNDDLPESTAACSMDQALSKARKIGYTGVELSRRMPQDTDGLRAYLDRYGIRAEQDPASAPPYEYSKLGYDHIVRICQRSGLPIDDSN